MTMLYQPSTGTITMRFLRIRQVIQLTGLSRMTIYRLELAGKFPKRRKLSPNSVAWREEEISQWLNTRPIADLRGSVGAVSITRRDV
jgi:prophage regulatory protein